MATSRPSKFPRVPYAHIRMIVGNYHVDQGGLTIAKYIVRRLKACKTHPPKPVTRSELREAVRYALAVHEDNRKTYRQVMGGSR